MATTSATCTTTQTNSTFDLGNVVAKGTASGPVGSRFNFDISNAGQSGSVTVDCGSWTVVNTAANNVECDATAGTPSINWTLTQEVYWCLSGCDSSPAQNNADLVTKYTTASIVDASNANQHTSTATATCP